VINSGGVEDRSIGRLVRSTTRATRVLEDVFERFPRRDYLRRRSWAKLITALRAEERVIWAGADRLPACGSIPEYVLHVPELLTSRLLITTRSGRQEATSCSRRTGFDGGLQREC